MQLLEKIKKYYSRPARLQRARDRKRARLVAKLNDTYSERAEITAYAVSEAERLERVVQRIERALQEHDAADVLHSLPLRVARGYV